MRLALGDVVTRDYLRHELEEVHNVLERIEAKLDDEAASRIALHDSHLDLAEPIQGDISEDPDSP